MCDCIKQIGDGLKENFDFEGHIQEIEILSRRTYSNFKELKVKGKKQKEYPVLHSYCPFCGGKYEKK